MDEREIVRLVGLAEAASENAYCPYSNFNVGAAVQTKQGMVFTGCNVENISFGATICAERVAIASAITAGYTEFETIAIYHNGDTMPYPCGICRQVLAEFGKELTILISNGEHVEVMKLKDLLPHNFDSDEI